MGTNRAGCGGRMAEEVFLKYRAIRISHKVKDHREAKIQKKTGSTVTAGKTERLTV